MSDIIRSTSSVEKEGGEGTVMGEGRHRWAAALLFRSQVHAKTEPVRTDVILRLAVTVRCP